MMVDHIEILEAALGALGEGIIVLDGGSRVLFWSQAATATSGYAGEKMLGRSLPEAFYALDPGHHGPSDEDQPAKSEDGGPRERPTLVNLCHQQSHSLPAMLRRVLLRDAFGQCFGTLLCFHPVEEIDTLPHGEAIEDSNLENRLEQSQAGMEDRLDEASRDWNNDAVPYGLIWILVDQGATLRKTHGQDASEAMLAIVEKTLLHGLKPTEILGRWGSNEFLVISHERAPEILEAHARHLAGLTRTSDFRWWGDRANLTVSIGVAQADHSETLSCLLKRAQKGMQNSQYAGGNRVTGVSSREMANMGGRKCSQS